MERVGGRSGDLLQFGVGRHRVVVGERVGLARIHLRPRGMGVGGVHHHTEPTEKAVRGGHTTRMGRAAHLDVEEQRHVRVLLLVAADRRARTRRAAAEARARRPVGLEGAVARGRRPGGAGPVPGGA